MAMNRLALLSCFAVVASCAPNPGPLFITQFSPLDDSCAFDTSFFTKSGAIDLAGSTVYERVVMTITGNAELSGPSSAPTSASQPPLETAGRILFLDQIILRYKSSTRGNPLGTRAKAGCQPTAGWDSGFVECDFVPIGTPATGETELFMFTQLIGPNMKTRLDDLAATNLSLDLFVVNVSIEVTGRVQNHQAAITTGPVAFPLTISKTDCGARMLGGTESRCAKLRGLDGANPCP
jgi:hypothetical protein